MIDDTNRSLRHVFTLSAGLLAGIVAGPVGPVGCGTGSGGTAGGACLETCTAGGEPAGYQYTCYCNMAEDEEVPPDWQPEGDLICAESKELADDHPEIDTTCIPMGCDCKARCELKGGSVGHKVEGVPCEGTTTTTTSGYETEPPTTAPTTSTSTSTTTGEFPQCDDWDPAANVLFSAGDYYIKWNFLNSVIDSPYHLVACDSARFELQTGGGFELNSAVSSDLLYLLGLRNGDVPTQLNGMPLATLNDVIAAFGELWLNESETQFTLTVTRNNASVSFEYSPWIAF